MTLLKAPLGALLVVFLTLGSPQAFAASKPRVHVYETSDVRVLFYPTGMKLKTPEGKLWDEYVYKFVRINPAFTSPTGWFSIRVTDLKGFALFSDLVHEKDFLTSGEYYSFFWLHKTKAERAESASVQALKEAQVENAKKNKILYREMIERLIRASGLGKELLRPLQISGTEIKESFEGSETDKNLIRLDQNLEELRQKQAQADPAKPAKTTSAAQTAEKKKDPYRDPPERITNADVEVALKELELEIEDAPAS